MSPTLWNIVLAAGAGRRLASVTGGIPKQFWSADGGPSLLEDTLARSAVLAPPERTVIVVDRSHRRFVHALPDVERVERVNYQPRDRGTARDVPARREPSLNCPQQPPRIPQAAGTRGALSAARHADPPIRWLARNVRTRTQGEHT